MRKKEILAKSKSRSETEELYVLRFSPRAKYFDAEMQKIREEMSHIKCAHKYENYSLDMLDQTITDLLVTSEQKAKQAIKSMLIRHRYSHYEDEQRKK
jgi:cytidylate kinase